MESEEEASRAPIYSVEDLAPIADEFFETPLVACRRMYGGYSGANYRIQTEGGSCKFVLKITDGCSTPTQAEKLCRTVHATQAEKLCRTVHTLNSVCCVPLPKNNASEKDEFRFVSLLEPRSGAPAFVLTWVKGRPADRVMRESPWLAHTVLAGIGQGLARMHLAVSFDTPQDIPPKMRWYPTDGGCCQLQDHVSGKTWSIVSEQKDLKDQPFVAFYHSELRYLQQQLKVTGFDGSQPLPLGITHGHPFADSVFVDPTTGELDSFVHIEDISVGPLLFDLASCTIGSCFSQNDNRFDLDYVEALWKGYFEERPLMPVERQYLIPYLRVALLCHCAKRFCDNHTTEGDEDTPQAPKRPATPPWNPNNEFNICKRRMQSKKSKEF